MRSQSKIEERWEEKTAKTARRFDYLLIVQGYYCNGWEDETAETTPREARERLREYRENMPQCAHRIVRRRVLRVPGGE